jgi:hypothetical protein
VNRLPDHQQPNAPQAGQPTINPNALAFLNDVEDALAEANRPAKTIPTYFRDHNPIPAIGTAPPVPQPGRAAMSEKAVDDTARMIGASVVIAVAGGSTTAVLWASGHANPTVIAWVVGGIVAVPAVLALPVLALKGLMKSAKEVAQAAPATHNHHYSGNVYQDHRSTHTETRGIWATTRNELPK